MSEPTSGRLPRPPGYAWRWLQRSRPVVSALAERLTGGPPPPDFVETLRARFAEDPFVQDVVADTIAEVAFRGRIPRQRPPGASWDRGLTWWAATLAGERLTDYEATGPAGSLGQQRPLFDGADGADTSAEHDQATATGEAIDPGEVLRRGRTAERAALAAELRELLAQTDGDQIPAAAVRDLLGKLEAAAR
ncbi:hypothetical protein ER308_05325 [Egibacter rhizosphaerae]|uniref:Uncharacterized protein n=1 Tax=Egibacter rhizosphaerae TaxID=1670831 RepID=A0A411YCY2_9ACTN|nr:hypothetical protein [Egibacter rhizosphaerae]QBI19022.1 hypothetical protein ER308_05325 [Egibacter rhizosphaerae]